MASIIGSIKKRYQQKLKFRHFMKQWKIKNDHNRVVPIKIFDIHRVKIGSHSYGALDLYVYNEHNKKDILQIGNFVSISSGVKFFLDEYHQTNTFTTFPLKSVFFGTQSPDDALCKGSIVIDDEVWIGANVTIMSGVRIGKGSIIATGSVVQSDIPPYCIAGGVPAKIIKFRFEEEFRNKLIEIKLINIPREIVENNIDIFYKELNLKVIQEIETLARNNKEKNGSIGK